MAGDGSPPPIPRQIGRARFGLQRIVERAPTHEVTRIGPEVHTGFPTTAVWREVKALYRSGLHPAVALHIRHKGEVVMDRTIGHVWNTPQGDTGPVCTPDTLFSLFSASKIVTASLVHAMVEDGLIALHDPVVAYLPAFGRHGKDAIQIRHLLNHTAGIPDMPHMDDVEQVIATGAMPLELLYDLKPQSPPGARAAYHPLTSWFLLQEILEQVSGRPLRELLHDRILGPLGFENLTYGVPADKRALVAKHAVTGPPVPGMMSRIFQRSIGVTLAEAIGFTNQDAFLDAVLPSANVIGTPAEAGRFMQMLLQGGELDGVRVLKPATIQTMISDVTSAQFDGTFGFPMRYGLGVMMGGNRFSLFGLGTRGAFGHLGLSNVVVYADPSRDLSVAFLNTGKPMMAPGMLRWYAVMQHIAVRVPKKG